jgi:hypothetical protein
VSDSLVNITAFVIGTPLLAVIGAAYIFFAWHCRHRLGGRALLLLWAGVSFTLGYVGYRHACSGALTCGLGRVDYRARLIPIFAFMGAVGFAVATAIVQHYVRRSPHATLGHRRILLSAAGVVLGFVLAAQLVAAV